MRSESVWASSGAARRIVAAVALALVMLKPLAGFAHETDQYTLPLGREFADLGVYLSGIAHDAIADAVDSTNSAIRDSLISGQPTDETARLQSGDYIAGEVWANLFAALPTVEIIDARLTGDALRERFPGLVVAYRPEQFIYDDPLLLIDLTKAVRTFFRSATVNVNGTLFGTDKLLHFIHMGRIYHSAYLSARNEGLKEEEAMARAVDVSATSGNPILSENGLLGLVTTGIRSNADLASDYAGLKFYRNLTEPVRIGGVLLPPMLVKEGLYWRLTPRVRAGSDFFAAFITPHFNEALNPNTYGPLIDTRVRPMLRARCFDLLDWYRDERGRLRSRRQFEAIERELSTFYGEPYGYESAGKESVSIASTCFDPKGAAERARLSAEADRPAVAARATHVAWGANAQPTWIRWPGSDRFGRTELWWAAREGRVEEVKRQIDRVENPNARDMDDEGPLHAAARGGHTEIVRLLIAYGADPRAKDRYGTTPLHVAVEAAWPETARALLRAGADTNSQDIFGMRPLHQAVLAGDREMAALLLDHGADRGVRYRGSTPAQLASRAGNESFAVWLVSYRTGSVARVGNVARH